MIQVEGRLHHVVLDYPPQGDGWVIDCVFAKEEDAVAQRDRLNSMTGSLQGAYVERMTMEQVKDMLFEERLSSLAPLVKQVLEKLK